MTAATIIITNTNVTEPKTPFSKPSRSYNNNIKMDLR
jgi:hypothetical protein